MHSPDTWFYGLTLSSFWTCLIFLFGDLYEWCPSLSFLWPSSSGMCLLKCWTRLSTDVNVHCSTSLQGARLIHARWGYGAQFLTLSRHRKKYTSTFLCLVLHRPQYWEICFSTSFGYHKIFLEYKCSSSMQTGRYLFTLSTSSYHWNTS